MPPSELTILPAQAERIAQVAAQAGCAVGVTQSGSVLTLNTGSAIFVVDAGGQDMPSSNQESLC